MGSNWKKHLSFELANSAQRERLISKEADTAHDAWIAAAQPHSLYSDAEVEKLKETFRAVHQKRADERQKMGELETELFPIAEDAEHWWFRHQ